MSDPRLASSHLHANVERLEAQVALSWGQEARALKTLGLVDGMSILEVGCGPGFVTERLLDMFPHSRVIAVEPDPGMSSLARNRLREFLGTRLDIVDASISMTFLEDDAFDFAFARYVFQHLTVPDIAVADIFRVLQPGGRVVIIDVDDDIGGLQVPSFPAIRRAFQIMQELQMRRGGDRKIGRKLWRLLATAGFHDMELQALVVHSDDLGLEAFALQYDPRRVREWVVPGGLTMPDWESYCVEYDELRKTPDALILEIMLVASAVKPVQN